MDRHYGEHVTVMCLFVNEHILVKFGTLIDIGQIRVNVAKYHTFRKIQDEFGFLTICQLQKNIFASNLACKLILAIQGLLWSNTSHR